MEPQPEASSPIAHLGQSPLTEIGQCLDPIETRLQWAKQALDAGHDVNELDLNTDWRRNKGRPLHSALEHPGRMDEMTAHDRGRNESLDLVKFLLERGADPRLRDCRGKETAMDRARCVLGSPVGDVERSFVDEALRLMEEAARKMEQKETTSKGWLFGGVVLSQLLSLAAAVDLRLYNTDYSCNGNRLICSNIPQQTCCVPRVEYYYSASCLNCDSGMTHYGWQRDGGIACSRVVVSRRGGSNNCIVQSGVTIFALYGQTWQYNSRKRDGKA
ncbi:hypothetical protein VDGE_06145 [Verticillium dahliae]|uniref:Ankyrin repeat protein n=1 Tax=Verticillium dahliae TaxID=27337 RepID=A0A444RPF2_VERDA|nr:hypothetical protein VDGE_06145 [Verticillium dahliae]